MIAAFGQGERMALAKSQCTAVDVDGWRRCHQFQPLALLTRVGPEVDQIASDRRRVEQVLINLLSNAVEFTEKGEVSVECLVRDDRLVTRVVDTGMGIKPEDMGKLFEVFGQIDSGLARQHEGTGLGLSICKRLVEMLGGEIWVESEWGVGSTFTLHPAGVNIRRGI